ncbi:MAG TPA: hypothetical protein H9671_03630 [Firmicutes bacterium]|nr:hypothetical protein [Bacillota bacterium]
MNQERFLAACQRAVDMSRMREGIGRLGEKTIHAALKYYFEPEEQGHEIQIGGFVADIVGENGIIEIQTRQLFRLKKKLEAYLPVCPVTVVYPIIRNKWVIWMDMETGELTPKRKSPKTGNFYEAFVELYGIKPFLNHPNLQICLLLLDAEEYRYLNGWSRDKKKGSSRCDRIPIGLSEERCFSSAVDYLQLVPSLKDGFTSLDFGKSVRISRSLAQTALNVLESVGAVRRLGRDGKGYLYARTDLSLLAAEETDRRLNGVLDL